MTPEEYKSELEKKVLKPKKKEVMTTKEHLKAMATYFELDEKKVRFYLKQLELSGKL